MWHPPCLSQDTSFAQLLLAWYSFLSKWHHWSTRTNEEPWVYNKKWRLMDWSRAPCSGAASKWSILTSCWYNLLCDDSTVEIFTSERICGPVAGTNFFIRESVDIVSIYFSDILSISLSLSLSPALEFLASSSFASVAANQFTPFVCPSFQRVRPIFHSITRQ